jgi:hypothetical protein
MTTERRIAMARDLVLFIFGLAGIAYQQLNEVNFVLLAIFTTMTGVPGLTNLVGILRGSSTAPPLSSPVSPEQATGSEPSQPT